MLLLYAAKTATLDTMILILFPHYHFLLQHIEAHYMDLPVHCKKALANHYSSLKGADFSILFMASSFPANSTCWAGRSRPAD